MDTSGGRRRFLDVFGVAGATLVAGCLGADAADSLDGQPETATEELCRDDVPTTRYNFDAFAFTFVGPVAAGTESEFALDVRPTFGVFGDFAVSRGDHRLDFSVSQSLTPVSAEIVAKRMETGPSVPEDRVTFFHDFTQYDGRELDGFHYASNDRDDRPYPEIFWIPFTMPSGDVRYLQCEMGLAIRPGSRTDTASDACLSTEDRLRTGFFDSLEPNADTTVVSIF
jgi:hypothetical protein